MTETFHVSVKKWGNSLGAVLPKNIVQKNKLKENDKIRVFVVKDSDVLKRTFGKLKGKVKQSSQDMKRELKEKLYN
jgi:antitoxin component of MazEF toxin-antitoxin module